MKAIILLIFAANICFASLNLGTPTKEDFEVDHAYLDRKAELEITIDEFKLKAKKLKKKIKDDIQKAGGKDFVDVSDEQKKLDKTVKHLKKTEKELNELVKVHEDKWNRAVAIGEIANSTKNLIPNEWNSELVDTDKILETINDICHADKSNELKFNVIKDIRKLITQWTYSRPEGTLGQEKEIQEIIVYLDDLFDLLLAETHHTKDEFFSPAEKAMAAWRKKIEENEKKIEERRKNCKRFDEQN